MTELDEVLGKFHKLSPIWSGSLANHGPMACEALEELGHSALIPAMADRYTPRVPLMRKGRPVPAENEWRALGKPEFVADWVATFEKRLSQGSWEDVLLSALEFLCDGLFGSAGHGYLRTAHAARALEKLDTENRRRELAHGLGFWAATYKTLPGEPGKASKGPFKDALATLTPPHSFDSGQLLTRSIEALAQLDSFKEVVAWPSFSEEQVMGDSYEIARTAANCFQSTEAGWIAAAHGITIASALRLFGLDPKSPLLLRLNRRSWQACVSFCALCPKDRVEGQTRNQEVSRIVESTQELSYLAACSLDEHVIKLTEACIREFNSGREEIFLKVASRAVLGLETKSLRVC